MLCFGGVNLNLHWLRMIKYLFILPSVQYMIFLPYLSKPDFTFGAHCTVLYVEHSNYFVNSQGLLEMVVQKLAGSLT